MEKLVWQIRYVDSGFNKQCEPVDIKWFEYNEIEKALEYLNILAQANLCINMYETWFIIELVKINEDDVVVKTLLKYRGEE